MEQTTAKIKQFFNQVQLKLQMGLPKNLVLSPAIDYEPNSV